LGRKKEKAKNSWEGIRGVLVRKETQFWKGHHLKKEEKRKGKWGWEEDLQKESSEEPQKGKNDTIKNKIIRREKVVKEGFWGGDQRERRRDQMEA